MEILIALLILAALAWFVTVPLRGGEEAGAGKGTEDPRRADLEARKEALYRQIRDLELDREQGKLAEADFRRLDVELRREAIEVLRELDAIGD
jgi:cytochrome c-type biogenesis protein CcmI